MRELFFLLVALCVGIFAATDAQAWDVCEKAAETLEVVREVTFTSSFCNCQNNDIITVEITPDDPSVTINRVEFIKATPHWQTNESRAEQTAITPLTADVILHNVTDKTKTMHLWAYMSIGEHIGVNAHF